MPNGIRYADEYHIEGADLVYALLYPDQQIWDLTNIVAGTHAKITMKAQHLLTAYGTTLSELMIILL